MNDERLKIPSTPSRRHFLQGSAALVGAPLLSSLLVSCSGGGRGGGGGGTTTLNAVLWAGIFDQSLPWFQDENDIKVNLIPQVDPIQSANMVRSQPGEIDIVSFGAFDSPMVYDGLAVELDRDRITEAWDVQYEYFQQMWDPKVFAPEEFDGNVFNVPYQWGSTVLAWNTKEVSGTPDSWSIMTDPAYKGKTAFNDQAAEMYATWAVALGQDVNSRAEADVAAINGLAAEWFANARMLWSSGDDIKQLMAQGEVVVAHIWDGTARQLIAEGYDIEYAYPVEGVRGTVDGPGIMVGSENVDAAYDFINFSMSERFGIEMGETTFYASGNKNVAEALNPETREIMRIDQMGELLESGKFSFQKLQAEDFAELDSWWTDLKLEHQG